MFVGKTLGKVLAASVSVYVCTRVLSLLLMLVNKSLCVCLWSCVSVCTHVSECVNVET